MRAIDRLFWAKLDFENAWRAHAVALRSVQVVLELPTENDLALSEALSRTDGFEAGFDGIYPLEGLRFEAQQVQDTDYFWLRRNCLLGICASFEDYVKTVAAALSYEPAWRNLKEGERLLQNTEADFHQRFAEQDRAWRKVDIEKPETYFFANQFSDFPGLNEYVEQRVREVFWFRNQFAHNANRAGMKAGSTGKVLEILGQTVFPGDRLQLDSANLTALTQYLRSIVMSISDDLPFFEARLP